MGYEKSKAHSLSRIEARKLGLALLLGCCVVIFTYFISMSDDTTGSSSRHSQRSRFKSENNKILLQVYTVFCFLFAGNRQPYASYTVQEDAVAETMIIPQVPGEKF